MQGSNVKVPLLSSNEEPVIKCPNCDGPMGALHQCGGDLVSPPKETVVQNGSMSLKKLQQFCSVCEIFYKYGTVHQCQTVKCIVCQALGRETSLVQCGSTVGR